MALYKTYPAHIIFARRAFAVAAGVLAKTSEQPVWLAQAEKVSADFY